MFYCCLCPGLFPGGTATLPIGFLPLFAMLTLTNGLSHASP